MGLTELEETHSTRMTEASSVIIIWDVGGGDDTGERREQVGEIDEM